MIKKLRVKNFKALRDIEIELTPIHVLIGPNDSGKTSILEVLAALCRSVDHELNDAFLGCWKGTELVWAGLLQVPVSIDVDFVDESIASYGISVLFGSHKNKADIRSEFFKEGTSTVQLDHLENHTWVKYNLDHPNTPTKFNDKLRGILNNIEKLLEGIHYYRFNASFLALPVAPDANRRYRMETNGFGLALLLDDILGFDRDMFNQLEKKFIEAFPHIKSIKIIPEEAFRAPVDNPEQVPVLNKAYGKGLYFEMNDSGQLIPASQVSDGTLSGSGILVNFISTRAAAITSYRRA